MPATVASKGAASGGAGRKRAPAPPWPVADVLGRLAPLHGPAESPRIYDPISELIYTILSQNTADSNSIPAYHRLVAKYPTWDAVLDAPQEGVIDAIRQGGLAQIKGPRIQAILREIKARVGHYDLSFLAEMPLTEAKTWLRSLPGVGPKTAGCVLLFSLGLPALPVDTHVYRVAKRLGLFDHKVDPERSHDILEAMLNPEQVLPFHMYLINHGRKVCKAPRPLCAECPLEERCPASLLHPGPMNKGSRSKAVPRRSGK